MVPSEDKAGDDDDDALDTGLCGGRSEGKDVTVDVNRSFRQVASPVRASTSG